MGFFDSVGGFLRGKDKPATSNSGFGMLPEEIQKAFTGYADDVTSRFGDGRADDLFTPLPQTEYEGQALETVGQGLAPTQKSLRADIGMQMNPYDDFVIDTINREAQGDYSILKQGLNEAGQMGSNRQMLGASDIDEQRLNQIGRFKQDQYNTALNNSLGQMTQTRAGDIGRQFGAGEFLRGLDTQTRQTPINALKSYGQNLGVLPMSGGSQSSGPVDKYGAMDLASDAGKIASTIAMLKTSDERLKKDIVKVGERNGFNLYEFAYKWSPQRFVGVMAQEVKKTMPEAIVERNGYMMVDYGKIGFNMEAV